MIVVLLLLYVQYFYSSVVVVQCNACLPHLAKSSRPTSKFTIRRDHRATVLLYGFGIPHDNKRYGTVCDGVVRLRYGDVMVTVRLRYGYGTIR